MVRRQESFPAVTIDDYCMMKHAHALITGATKGIGRAISRHFAEAGCSVTAVARSESDLRHWQEQWQQSFPHQTFSYFICDLSDPVSRADLLRQISEAEVSYSVLVNNAAAYLRGPLLEEPAGQFAEMWQINVQAPYELIRALVPKMVEQGRGHVFNICSVASRHPQPGSAAYSATKAALLNLTHSLRAELLDHNVSVTAVLPGQTWSASWEGVTLPHNRLMQSDDIGAAVANAWQLGPSSVVEEIVLRPQRGDWAP